jgi:KaiC/GvpD/RAD55 family RecA-like ATPase
MEKLSAEVKEHNDSLKNLMSNDQELSQLEEQAKAITTDLRAKQQRIKESPESVQIQVKVKELKEELSELKAALNNYLLRYYQMTGSTVIEDDTGDEREIVFQAKLGRKKSA